jgi:hypothetical protein
MGGLGLLLGDISSYASFVSSINKCNVSQELYINLGLPNIDEKEVADAVPRALVAKLRTDPVFSSLDPNSFPLDLPDQSFFSILGMWVGATPTKGTVFDKTKITLNLASTLLVNPYLSILQAAITPEKYAEWLMTPLNQRMSMVLPILPKVCPLCNGLCVPYHPLYCNGRGGPGANRISRHDCIVLFIYHRLMEAQRKGTVSNVAMENRASLPRRHAEGERGVRPDVWFTKNNSLYFLDIQVTAFDLTKCESMKQYRYQNMSGYLVPVIFSVIGRVNGWGSWLFKSVLKLSMYQKYQLSVLFVTHTARCYRDWLHITRSKLEIPLPDGRASIPNLVIPRPSHSSRPRLSQSSPLPARSPSWEFPAPTYGPIPPAS